MYGFIHCALEDLVVSKYGKETWEKILKKSGIRLRGGSFLIHKVYGDDVTLKLVKATAEILEIELDACLEVFGQHFLTFCQHHGYDKILRILGSNLQDFLTNLDNLHDHLGTTYPGMRAPSFRTSQGSDGSLVLHYYSERQGLQAIVRGLVKVIAKEFFHTEVIVQTLEVNEKGQRKSVVFNIKEKDDITSACSSGIPRFVSVTQNLSTNAQDLPIGVQSFCKAFPFHMMFRRDFTITQVGKSLLRLTNIVWKNKKFKVKFTDLFEVCRPVVDCTFDAILDHENMVFVIQTKEGIISSPDRLRLKGQMVSVPESESLLFICSPRVKDLNQMTSVGVYFNDFPVHDRGRDLILLGHHRRGERELVEKLDEASNHLKILDKKLRDDKKRTEELLQSIFPGHVATQLCKSLPVEAERFDLVTCLFSDIVGFTALCSTAAPIDIVRLLNRLYLQFDNLTSFHDVYKVETIGDAYVVVSGVPKFVPNHADRIIAMALAMVEVTKYVTSPVDGMPIEIRVGVHSGPAVAGVLGMKMPRYCLLGNTVTLANLLESKSEPGKVTISESSKRCLTLDAYEFEDNPKTHDLSVPGCFVTRIAREGDTTDMAALTVSGGGMFRSPTNSPGHSDEATNDSNSPSLQSPSPHLTFKGTVCIPHIEVPAHLDIRSPRTASPSRRDSDGGRIFVFPPSPIPPIPCTIPKNISMMPSSHKSTLPMGICSFASSLTVYDRTDPYITSHIPAIRNGGGGILPKQQDIILHADSFLDLSSPPLTPLQPVPKRRVKKWTRAIIRNSRKWSSRKLGPSESEVDTIRATTTPSSSNRRVVGFRRLCSCLSTPGDQNISAKEFSTDEMLQETSTLKGSSHARIPNSSWKYFQQQRTCGVLSKVKLSTLF